MIKERETRCWRSIHKQTVLMRVFTSVLIIFFKHKVYVLILSSLDPVLGLVFVMDYNPKCLYI